MQFFLTFNKNENVSFSPFREMDKLNSKDTSYLSLPLNLSTIQIVLERLNRRRPSDFWNKRSKRKNLKIEILKILKDLGWDVSALTWEEVKPTLGIRGDKEQQDEIRRAFNRIVLGRQLSLSDLLRLARELKVDAQEIIKFAHLNVEHGLAQWAPAVKLQGSGWQCQRCG